MVADGVRSGGAGGASGAGGATSSTVQGGAGGSGGTGGTSGVTQPGSQGGSGVATGAQPVLVLDRPAASFGTVAVGTASPPVQEIVVVNQSTSSIADVAVTVSGPGFVCDPASTCSGPLAAGGSCVVRVMFVPVGPGDATGTVEITATPGGTVSASLTASATGTSTLVLTPSALDTGCVDMGESLRKQLGLANTGPAASDLSVIVSGTDFTLDPASTTCQPDLAAGQSCAISVLLAPTSRGMKSGNVIVLSSSASAAATLAGRTNVARLTFNKSSIDFTSRVGVDSEPVMLLYTDPGGCVSGPLKITFEGPNAEDFHLDDLPYCSPINAGNTCALYPMFKPSAVGTRTATLVLTDQAMPSVSARCDLIGTATP
jgi:hypothetical protein